MNRFLQVLAVIVILNFSVPSEAVAQREPTSEQISSLNIEVGKRDIFAAQLPQIDVNWVVAIATIAATVGTLLGVFIAQKQASREALDTFVSKASLDAKIGNTLISLRELESEVRQQLSDLLQQLEDKKKQLTLDIASREQTLTEIIEKSSLQAQTIEELLERANTFIPSIETAELIPSQIYLRAQSADNPYEKTTLLSKVLEHPDSDSRILELSGDLARQQLMNFSLAKKLYQRSVQLDPDNISARSEYLRLMSYSPSEREKAKEEIVNLAKNNPNDSVVVSNLMNFLLQISDYQEAEKIGLQLLEHSNKKSLLWRNIAVARQQLGTSDDEVDKAYDAAFGCGDNDDFVNSAKPYIDLLIKRGELERALEITNQALFFEPSYAFFHKFRGDIYKLLGQYDKAREAYELFGRLGDEEDSFKAQRLQNDLAIIHALGLEKFQLPIKPCPDGKLTPLENQVVDPNLASENHDDFDNSIEAGDRQE